MNRETEAEKEMFLKMVLSKGLTTSQPRAYVYIRDLNLKNKMLEEKLGEYLYNMVQMFLNKKINLENNPKYQVFDYRKIFGKI